MKLTDLDTMFHNVALGEHCSSRDAGCEGPVLVFRTISAQAHGTCESHNVPVRFPASLVPGFKGEKLPAGEHVVISSAGALGGLSTRLAESSSSLRSRAHAEGARGVAGHIRIAYSESGEALLMFQPVGKSGEAAVSREKLRQAPARIKSHLLDGYGVFCYVDPGDAGRVYWPEVELSAASAGSYEDRLSA